MVKHVKLEFELQLVRIVINYKIKINISKHALKLCESWNCQYACHQKKFTDYHNFLQFLEVDTKDGATPFR